MEADRDLVRAAMPQRIADRLTGDLQGFGRLINTQNTGRFFIDDFLPLDISPGF